MNEFYQFAIDNWMLSSAWVVTAVVLAGIQIKFMAYGPKSVNPQMLTNLVNRNNAVVVDIRNQANFSSGHIQGALNIPLEKLKDNTSPLEKYRNNPIIMVCANGIQVSTPCSALRKAGFEQVYKLTGGMGAWLGEGLPIVK